MENSQFRCIFLDRYYLLKTKIKRISLVISIKKYLPCFIARNYLEILFEMDSKFVIFMFCVIFMVETGVRGETESKGKVRILLFLVIAVKLVIISFQPAKKLLNKSKHFNRVTTRKRYKIFWMQ